MPFRSCRVRAATASTDFVDVHRQRRTQKSITRSAEDHPPSLLASAAANVRRAWGENGPDHAFPRGQKSTTLPAVRLER